MLHFPIPHTASPALVLCLAATLATASIAKADPLSGQPLLADQHAPAGVMFDHMHKKDEIMLGLRYAGSFAGGDMLHGENSANDQQVIDEGCTPHFCSMKPTDMTMNMYMIDLMYAPTDWLTLMVMPMYMSHDMTMGPLMGDIPAGHDEHGGSAHAEHIGSHSHGTEAWGDTIFGPEIRLADGPNYHLQVSPMISAPTGRVDFQTDGVFTHYGMQLGSGTWDFWPSITYTGRADRLAWGAQLLGIVRLEDENESGYRLGDVFQGTFWGSYRFATDFGVAAWALYRAGQGRGPLQRAAQSFEPARSPVQLWRPVLGYRLRRQHRRAGRSAQRVAAQRRRLQPVMDDPNGYQLEREGTLWANATMSF